VIGPLCATCPSFQVETRPDNPYSINIWGDAHENDFYIGSGSGRAATWAGHLEEDPNIRLRIGTDIYLLKAVRVTDEAEQTVVRGLYVEKYEDFEEQASSQDVAEGILVFRWTLAKRAPPTSGIPVPSANAGSIPSSSKLR
jgi:hypothetical protein